MDQTCPGSSTKVVVHKQGKDSHTVLHTLWLLYKAETETALVNSSVILGLWDICDILGDSAPLC
jgi:hypothetical protein